jgi:3-hydroxyisobutyrate dehydrogenase-like beta-hydroxyacid dehydrogenase
MGDMGTPMVMNLVNSGFDVTVFDIRPDALATAEQLGAKTAASLREIGERCDVVHLVVVNAKQVREVTTGPGNILESLSPGSTIILHTTVVPKVALELGEAAREKGIDVLDAPVTGATIAARTGTLTIMVGGDATVYERCRTIFETLGERIIYMGPLGKASAAKNVIGYMLHCNRVVALEAMKLATAYGIPEEKMVDLARTSAANSWVIQNWEHLDRTVDEGTMGPDLMIHYMLRKDIIDAVEAANDVHLYMPMGGLALQTYAGLVLERRRDSE